MNRTYRLSSEARIDLLQIWNYLAEHASFDIADKVITDLYSGMDEIAKVPALGHGRPDLTDLAVKFYRVHSYLIIYAPAELPIGVVRILHGSRDIPSILHSR
jgi:toxin ParE1/3/4